MIEMPVVAVYAQNVNCIFAFPANSKLRPTTPPVDILPMSKGVPSLTPEVIERIAFGYYGEKLSSFICVDSLAVHTTAKTTHSQMTETQIEQARSVYRQVQERIKTYTVQ
jgi:hypothetical protein